MGWHGPRGECGCCGDISSSSSPSISISDSISSSLSESSSSPSAFFDPCDLSKNNTLWLKIETFGFAVENSANWWPNCQPTFIYTDRDNLNGTWFLPLVRSVSGGVPVFALPGSTDLVSIGGTSYNQDGSVSGTFSDQGKVAVSLNGPGTLLQVFAASSPWLAEFNVGRPTCDPATWVGGTNPASGSFFDTYGCFAGSPFTQYTVNVSGTLRVSFVPLPAP
jgi:hypothetical protein